MGTIITNIKDLVANAATQYISENEETFKSTVPGPQGIGLKGEDGIDGTSITVTSVQNNIDKSITIRFSDGTVHTTDPLKGVDGTSVTVVNVTNNVDGTLKIDFSDGTSHTTADLRGPRGFKGEMGDRVHHISYQRSRDPLGNEVGPVEPGQPGYDDTYAMWMSQEELPEMFVGDFVVHNGLDTVTAEDVKALYESNADTNVFTDAEKTKLGGLETSTQLDDRDTTNRDRANHTGTQLASTISDFDTAVGGSTQVNLNTTKLISIEFGATADQLASEVPFNNTSTGFVASNVQTALVELETGKEDKSDKGMPNGYAGLGVDGKVDSTQMPTYVTSVAGKTGVVTLEKGDVGLGNVQNVDTTNATNISSGTLNASRLANSGVTAGTYRSVTTDARGRITAGTNPTTLAGYGITDAVASSHVGSNGTSHAVATTTVNGFMSSTDKTKLDGLFNYTKPVNEPISYISGLQIVLDSKATTTALNTEKARIDAILSGAGANVDTFAEIVTLINSVDTTNDDALAGYVTSNNARVGNIETNVTNLTSNKVDKVAGKQLSTEDYTTSEKNKLSTLENYTLPTATSTVKGGVEIFSDTVQTVDASSVSSTTGRTYGIQLNAAGQAVVNVPWVDYSNTTITVENVLTSTSTTNALSAAQGKELNTTKANINSPEFTGVPKAPTASVGTSTTQLATTAFVLNELNKTEEW